MKHTHTFLIFFLFYTSILSASALKNQLAGHASPYLAMHGDDPVAWQDWSDDVLVQAKQQGKMIFISSGYFACHWCHVMQKESYKNKEIAAILNTQFIPVKVDRELLPALDQHLIDFVQRTQGSAGWPLNVFLTPEGYPLVGMTYVTTISFKKVLTGLAALWEKDTVKPRDLARRALLKMSFEKEQANSTVSESFSSNRLNQKLIENTYRIADEFMGGFGQQSRFPMAPQLKVLLLKQAAEPDDRLKTFLRLTLDQMADIGLRDHLAGGFYRYTVDPQWLEPHYEKMLYTQAQLIEIYLLAADVLDRPDYRKVVIDTLEFVLHTMQGQQGAYIASFSAVDDKGIEGGYYLWPEEELVNVLNEEELKLARPYWILEGDHDIDEGYLPKRGVAISLIAKKENLTELEVLNSLNQSRHKLMQARSKRILPVDDKELAGWNGLLLMAFSKTAMRLNDQRYTEKAQALKNILFNQLWDGKEIFRAKSKGEFVGSAALSDYAYMAYGLSEWIKLAGTDSDKEMFEAIIATAWQRFYLGKGWQQSDQALLPGMSIDAAEADGALPSAVALLIKLSLDSKDPKIKALAEKAKEQTKVTIEETPFWYASHAQLFLVN